MQSVDVRSRRRHEQLLTEVADMYEEEPESQPEPDPEPLLGERDHSGSEGDGDSPQSPRVSPNKFLRQQEAEMPTSGSLIPRSAASITDGASLFSQARSRSRSTAWEASRSRHPTSVSASTPPASSSAQKRSASASTPSRAADKTAPRATSARRATKPPVPVPVPTGPPTGAAAKGVLGRKLAPKREMSPGTIEKLNGSVLSLSIDGDTADPDPYSGADDVAQSLADDKKTPSPTTKKRVPGKPAEAATPSPPATKMAVVRRTRPVSENPRLSVDKSKASFVSRPIVPAPGKTRTPTAGTKTVKYATRTPFPAPVSVPAESAGTGVDRLVPRSTVGMGRNVRYDTDRLVDLLEDMNILS